MEWKSRLSGYQVPAIEDGHLEKARLPLFSFVVFILISILIIRTRGSNPSWKIPVIPVMLILAFGMYPFLRHSLGIGILNRKKPSQERTSDVLGNLLTNVYRAFIVRSEEKVYDRLAISVTGDQLRDIYLENRQSMELENRGGARANVDEINVLDVARVKRPAKVPLQPKQGGP